MAETAKIALVTGGGTGIGRAAAEALLGAGWKVVVTGRHQETLDETLKGAQAGAENGLAIVADVADPDAVDALFAETEKRFGRLDLLFNNAGTGSPATTIDEIPVETFKRVIDVNVTGAFLCARAAFALMRRQKPQGGRIINNGSISAHAPRVGSVPYTTSKHAVSGLTKALALDGRPFQIACGQIDIGNAATALAEKMTRGVPQASGHVMAEPVMAPEEVGAAVLHMASLPLSTNILSMTIMATNMPFVGRG
ncbi:SDR family oxidoreductase [Afifella sp. IM 167]|uniref:SDR family oxidoreductase n=1 Tax=Afifella sp. IM 167 TaxID=2033586 RepID=UPI001CCED81D|nr:SDR family oxidoreductase [Afifella sp. IM 167]MBZ8133963.1 3-oxoacyl-ACP reductase [Afifella sp. IM 167]